MASGRRYSSISLDLLMRYRTVLARQTDPEGTISWTAKVVGMPWCEASGPTRTEALRRVREMAEAKRPRGGSLGGRRPARQGGTPEASEAPPKEGSASLGA
jgi:hypothetical protein